MKWARALGVLAALGVLLSAAVASSQTRSHAHTGSPAVGYAIPQGIHKIKHIVIIMQENRSFDNYFGTYPGAAGIPMRKGQPAVCIPAPAKHTCVKPYHDRRDYNFGGPHDSAASAADINGGKMNGFLGQQEQAVAKCGCGAPNPPNDAVGYHTGKEIPNYWAYARNFVLQDHMFQPEPSWSLPSHLDLVS